jgi:hypothetical protein
MELSPLASLKLPNLAKYATLSARCRWPGVRGPAARRWASPSSWRDDNAIDRVPPLLHMDREQVYRAYFAAEKQR